MRKKSFVHSWGRKMFFGIGWGLTSVVALNYFQSMILPLNFSGWIYFLSTFIGHYGLLISLLYFFLFWPVTYISPSYYVSRIWSITLLVGLNTFIFIDSFLFSKYRYHVNSFLASFLKSDWSVFGFNSLKWSLLGAGILVLVIVLWIRGERLWRQMQGRFSNPVKNWYLVLIAFCLLLSHSMYLYSDAKGGTAYQRLSQLFPLYYPLTGKSMLKSQGLLPEQRPEGKLGYKDFYYPNKKLTCSLRQPKNVLLLVMENFGGDITKDTYPKMFHYQTHGKVFKSHFSGGLNPNEGLFSLLYSLPPIYMRSAFHAGQEPAFFSVLNDAHFDLGFYSSNGQSPLRQWLTSVVEKDVEELPVEFARRAETPQEHPFFLYGYLDGNSTENEELVSKILESLQKSGLLSQTIIIITGATGENAVAGPASLKTNLLIIWPGRTPGNIEHQTSHYDVIPALMQDEWKCKNVVSDYSFGQNLFTPKKHPVHVAGTYDSLNIIDFENFSVVDIDPSQGLKVKSLPDLVAAPEKLQAQELLKVLEQITLFYKRR